MKTSLFVSLSSVALAALLAGCATEPAPLARDVARREATATAADRRTAQVAERDRVLFDYRSAATAMRRGDDAEAKAKLDDAIARIGGLINNDAQAKKARSLFSSEGSKVFIGEPYERVMAYYYRGILYWRDGQPDNARACFRSGQVIDSNPELGKPESDYVLLDYLDGFVSTKLDADGSDALKRAQQSAGERMPLPPYDPTANVLVFAEFGYGPRKYAAGEYGEQLRFKVDDSPSRSARLVLDEGRRIVPLPAYDDLNYQATTRGGRVMDHILGNKAVFKSTTDAVSDAALVGAVIAANEGRRRDAQGKDNRSADTAAIGLGLLGIVGKIASAATTPDADTRQWNNLPQRLSFAALKLPPGEHRGRIEFLDRDGQVLERRTQEVTFSVASETGETVLFLSELKG